MAELVLEVRDFEGPLRWRWVLTEPDGRFVADHEVRLDPDCWQYEAFGGLHEYLQWRVAPDRRVEHEAEIVGQVGEWVGTEVLGCVGPALVAKRPVAVRVVIPVAPAAARHLMSFPLELAHVHGRPIAVQDITLVMQLGAGRAIGGASRTSDRLRVLGLFSVPDGERPLNLRRERQVFLSLFREIAAAGGRAIDAQVLQYGVTRDRLRDLLAQGEGWDVVHISGHGAPGDVVLETEEGRPDRIRADELAELLDAARERLTLVSLSACWSAAPMAIEDRRLPVQPTPDGTAVPIADETSAGHVAEPSAGGLGGGIAAELVDRLGCAVLAMRYPVTDVFAITLAQELYGLLAGKGQPLPRALGIALKATVAVPPSPEYPALSVAAPVLFGGQALGLKMAAPQRRGPESYDTTGLKLAGFPPQPERFVGRVRIMARASAALAPRSGVSGLLLLGMPGGGKTACAVELAYTHEHVFDRMVWFKAPDEGLDITDALTRFALTLEANLPGLRWVHLVDNTEQFSAFLPLLTELCEQRRLLIVIDNAESLITATGAWRDQRWEMLITALCGHAGLGRLILTSRQLPSGLDRRVHAETVDTLTIDESLLLARELPHLNDLINGRMPGADPAVAREFASSVLEMAQGHPKLLELADGQAADPGRLAQLLASVDRAWQEAGIPHEGRFIRDASLVADDDYLRVLQMWTRSVSAGLPAEVRALFWSLCCMEERDRIRPVIDGAWTDLRKLLDFKGDPLCVDDAVATLVGCGLVTVSRDTPEADESYAIHPGLVAAGRAEAGEAVQRAVDNALRDHWLDVFAPAREQGQTRLMARAALSVAPYLVRLSHLDAATGFLEQVLIWDDSRVTVSMILPTLRRIAAAAAGTDGEAGVVGALARCWSVTDLAAGEQQMRRALTLARTHGDDEAARAAVVYLIGYCARLGRLDEALALAEDNVAASREAGLGPWAQLSDEVQRLQLLTALGQADEVLAETTRLRDYMSTLPEVAKAQDGVMAWRVREHLLNVAGGAAMQLKRYQDALDLNAELIAAKRAREAAETDLAQTLFNTHGPLRHLGRLDEAVALLRECRAVFERAHDIQRLGQVLNALATVEDQRGHGDIVLGLRHDALRYSYLCGDIEGITLGHHGLGLDLRRHAGDLNGAAVHHLAAALLQSVGGGQYLDPSVEELATDFRRSGDMAAIPADVAELCHRAEKLQGVALSRVLTELASPAQLQETLEQLTDRARARTAEPESFAPEFAAWDPVIAALVAAANGNADAAEELDLYLPSAEDRSQWPFGDVLRLIFLGNYDPDLADLDEAHTAIVRRALDALAGQIAVPAALWPAISLGPLLSFVVFSATGNAHAATSARKELDDLVASPENVPLAQVLERILGGDHSPDLPSGLDDPTDRAIVTTVLHHIGDLLQS
jgi:tetratricopeptide (TPR) repeat protein